MDFEIRRYREIDSTNIEAVRLSKAGAKEGTVVVAERQSAGKGRRGRTWESEETGNLYFSLLLRPEIEPKKAPMLTLVMAYSVAKALRLYLPDIQIKWPNDLIFQGKKICGILTEMHLEEQRIDEVIIGIGVNVNGCTFSEELRDRATSLALAVGEQVDKEFLLQQILQEFSQQYFEFLKKQELAFLQNEYNGILANFKREVRILEANHEYNGLALGINKKGELLVQKEDGSVEAVYAGEVSVRGVYGYM